MEGRPALFPMTTSITDPEPPQKPIASSYKWKALVTVALSTTMGTMDMSVTNIALPALSRIFEARLTSVMWVTV